MTFICPGLSTALFSAVLKSFEAINMKNAFLDQFIMNDTSLSHRHSLLGDFIGTLLNTNGTSIAEHLDCDTYPMDERFNCVDFLIKIMNGLMYETNINIVTGNFQSLVVPRIPDYQG